MEWRDMRSGQHVVSAEVLGRAWLRWMPDRGYMHLGFRIEDEYRKAGGEGDPDFHRLADRMVQKGRKAGKIEHLGGGKWRFRA